MSQSYSDTFTADVESDFGHGKSYDWLRDAVLHAFNPPDDDAAEESICEQAIFRAADFIAEHPCECTRMEDGEIDRPCRRCELLGEAGGEPVSR